MWLQAWYNNCVYTIHGRFLFCYFKRKNPAQALRELMLFFYRFQFQPTKLCVSKGAPNLIPVSSSSVLVNWHISRISFIINFIITWHQIQYQTLWIIIKLYESDASAAYLPRASPPRNEVNPLGWRLVVLGYYVYFFKKKSSNLY